MVKKGDVMVRVAINGFGRIGRMVLRICTKRFNIDVVAINDLTDTKTMAYLFKNDSVHGVFPGTAGFDEKNLFVNRRKINVFSEKEPENLPWKKLKIDVVVDCTGLFLTKDLATKHLTAGARKVLLSANYKGDQFIKTLIRGVNLESYDRKKDHIISKGSCTTTCLSPIVKVLDDALGIEKGFMTTAHSVTVSQKILDSPHKTLREGRGLLNNIIPTETGAAVAVARVIPELEGKIDGMAMRVPTQDGSIVDFTCIVKKKTSVEEVNKIFREAAKKHMKGVIQYSEEELVSSDIVGNPYSSIFDSKLTRVNGNLVKVLAWYDNEFGYSTALVDMIKFIS